jgi:quercetin dioxygenase-like cupin family protein
MIHIVRPGDGMLETFRLLATGEQTRGRYFALELGAPPGQATSGHSHDYEDEAEYVATGRRAIRIDDTVVDAPAGSFVLVSRGSLHDMWTVGDEPSRYIHLFSPAGIEHWFFERARLRSAGASRDELATAAARHGIRSERTSPPDAVPQVALHGDDDMLVVRGSQTNGAYALVAFTVELGRPTAPPHVHADVEEALYVADAEIEITADGETYVAPAGTFVFVPRGIRHSYSSRGDRPARVVAIVSPPQLDPYLAEAFPNGARP